MPTDPIVLDLMRRGPLAFIGTPTVAHAATMSDIPIDDRTLVVSVDHVLHAPDTFSTLTGHRITVQCDPQAAVPEIGQPLAFFTIGVAFGESILVQEVGRLTLEEIEPAMTQAATPDGVGGFEAAVRDAETMRLREQFALADAVVLGRVTSLEKVLPDSISEHDPDWWRATVEIQRVERGNLKGDYVTVLYANSQDVRWRASPKPRAAQNGLFLLHATEAPLQGLAPFQILQPDDLQPSENLDRLR
jgi:hypothetical protein